MGKRAWRGMRALRNLSRLWRNEAFTRPTPDRSVQDRAPELRDVLTPEQAEYLIATRKREFEELHAQHMSAWERFHSDAYLNELNKYLTGRTHEDVTPPWESDEDIIQPRPEEE